MLEQKKNCAMLQASFADSEPKNLNLRPFVYGLGFRVLRGMLTDKAHHKVFIMGFGARSALRCEALNLVRLPNQLVADAAAQVYFSAIFPTGYARIIVFLGGDAPKL